MPAVSPSSFLQSFGDPAAAGRAADPSVAAPIAVPLPASATDAPAESHAPFDRPRSWRPSASIRVGVLGCFLLASLGSLYLARPILLPVLIAMLLALLLSPAVSLLERGRVPRSAAALVVLTTVLAMLGGLGTHLYGPVQQWMNAGPEQLAELQRKFSVLSRPIEAIAGIASRVAQIATPHVNDPKPREVVVERGSLLGFLNDTQAVLVSTMTVLILLYFLLASGDLFLRKLIRVIPNLSDKIRAVEISRTIQAQIGRYFGAITSINVALGVVVGLLVGWIGLPTPALIGTLVGLFNFIPYLGPLLSLSMITVVSALTFDTLPQILTAPLAFSAIALVEGQAIQPVVLGRHLSTTPVVMFLWVVFWGWLWGVGGVAVAVPLLVVVKICSEHIPSWAPIAALLGRD